MNNITSSELLVYGAGAVALLAFNAVFVAAEFSLIKLRYTRFASAKLKEAKRSPAVAVMLDNMSASIKALRLGISICSIGTGFLVSPLALALANSLGWAEGWQLRWSVLLSFLVAVGAHFVLGELVPRAMALQHPTRSLKAAMPFVGAFRLLASPVSAFFNAVASLVLRVLRLDPSMDLNLLNVEAQIRSMALDGDELPEMAERFLSNVLELRKRVAYDIMIPRNQLQYIDTKDSVEDNLALVRKMGHTRFPICEGDLDHCVGLLHIKDLFRSGKTGSQINWLKIKRPIVRFAMDEPLERVLQRFLKAKKHFGLLTDEFGGTVGAVTLEDVLEELVGEIQDEFDRDEERISDMGDGLYEVDGLTPLHDLSEQIGVELEAEEVSTFGGYITYELGRMPKLKETFRIKNLEITATGLDARRVLSASVRVIASEGDGEERD